MRELFNAEVVLTRFPGKGGWTYAAVGELPFQVKTHFGTLAVSGQVDDVVLEGAQLMPMGQGRRFLPVNAALRKQLGKQAGDVVHLRLYAVELAPALTVSMADLVDCLAEMPPALAAFQRLGPAAQQQWLTWVELAETDEGKTARVEQAIERLAQGVLAPPKA
ncbi:MAG TPA: YdeI/OmpD-associated family protein [Hymenobacter sp.]|jgi:hypothetical protein|uniref:YdeI/OmpD-associated family protein n=1 Tax=Hymenobacter sp. TaxID=1898978 RepID=UPI002EDBB3EE